MFTIATPILKMSSRYKVMCGCECCIYYKIIHSSLLSWRDWYLVKSNHIYETYKNTVMPHGRHIYAKSYYISKATMCAYPQSDHALPH